MKGVSLGLFISDRKPFHTECWRKYHTYWLKRDILGAAIFVSLIPFMACLVFPQVSIPMFLLIIGLSIAYLKVKE